MIRRWRYFRLARSTTVVPEDGRILRVRSALRGGPADRLRPLPIDLWYLLALILLALLATLGSGLTLGRAAPVSGGKRRANWTFSRSTAHRATADALDSKSSFRMD